MPAGVKERQTSGLSELGQSKCNVDILKGKTKGVSMKSGLPDTVPVEGTMDFTEGRMKLCFLQKH